MGLKISEIIQKKEITLEQLKDKVIAVDAFNTLYQFLSNIRQPDGTPLMDSKGSITSHLSGLFYRTTNLMSKGLKLVFVFDGQSPELKEETHEERAKIKEEATAKFKTAETMEEKAKFASRISFLTKEMIKESKELIEALGLTAIQAPSEGEAQASFIAKQGDAYAVASQDYDSLLFDAPRLIQNLTLSRKRRLPNGAFTTIQPELIELSDVLKNLELTREQLIYLGILIGTDYNPGGVKGIGQKTALKLVKMHKEPEKIFSEVAKEKAIDFDWKEIFELFKKPDITKKYSIHFKKFNEEKIKKLLVQEHDFNAERINSALEKLENQQKSLRQSGLNKWI